MDQHLSDLDRKEEKEERLQRTENLGFSSPQSAEAWRQQVYQRTLERNIAAQQGYRTPDQYLGYLDQKRARIEQETAATRASAAVIKEQTDAELGRANAIRQTHESAGTLGTAGTSNIQAYGSAVQGIPTQVTTHVSLDDDEAAAKGAAYRAVLGDIPMRVSTSVRLDTDELAADVAKAKALEAALPAERTVKASWAPSDSPEQAALRAALQQRGEALAPQAMGPGGGPPRPPPPVAGPPPEVPEPEPSKYEALSPQRLEELQASVNRLGQTALQPERLSPAQMIGMQQGMGRAGQLALQPERMQAAQLAALQQGLPNVGRAAVTPGLMDAGQLLRMNAAVRGLASSVADLDRQKAAPEVKVHGAAVALSDVRSVKAAIKDLSAQIANPDVKIGSGAVIQQLQAIRQGMEALKADTRGLDIQPKGLDKLAASFMSVQGQASRAFDDITLKSGASGERSAATWRDVGHAAEDVFRGMKASAQDAGSGLDSVFATVASRVTAAFKGITGGGLLNVFGNLAQVAAQAGSQVIGSIGPMLATFTSLIQLLPPLVAGFGALGTVFAAMPETIASVGIGMVTLKEAISPVVAALGAYGQVLAAQQAAAANPLQTAMQTAQMQNQLANAYYQVAQAAFQAQQSEVQDAHAVSDAQFSLSQAVVQGSNTQVTSAHAVADAQFAVQQAAYQARISQVDDAHAVRDATFSLSQAQFSAGIQQTESAMSVASAQHSLADSAFATAQAQYQLNIAWQTAAEDLAALLLQVNSASVNLRGAQLSLEQAQQNYAQVMAQSTSTALDRAQAAYQIQEAEIALRQVELQNKDNETQLADVRKYGANQVFGVTQAQHALTDAQFSQVQAQKQLILTEKEAANAQIQAAHAVTDAFFGLWQAQQTQGNDFIVNQHNQKDAAFALGQAIFEQSQGRITSAHAVRDAEYALSQAYIMQGEGQITSAHDQAQALFGLTQAQDTMALGLPSIASAEADLATAMAKLGPAARTAVMDLEPLARWFLTNKSVGQAFFSQVDPGLSHISSVIGPLSYLLDSTARVLGQLAEHAVVWFEKLAHSPAWQVLTQGTVSDIRSVGEAIGHLADGFTRLAVIATPFTTWLFAGIDHLARRFDDWAAAADRSGSGFRKWLDAVRPVLDDVGKVIDAIVKGFAILAGGPMGSTGSLNSLKEFGGLMKELAGGILPDVFNALHALSSPALLTALTQLFGAVAHLVLVVVQTPGFQAGFQFFVRVLTDIADILAKIFGLKGVAGVLGNIVGAVGGLALGLGVALKFTGILDLIGHLKQVVNWAQTAYAALGKLVAFLTGGKIRLPGTGGETAAQQDAATTAAENNVTAGDTMLRASENMLTAGERMKTAGAAEETAGTEQETAAGEEAGAGGAEAAGGAAAADTGLLGSLTSLSGLAGLVVSVISIGGVAIVGALIAKGLLDRFLGTKGTNTVGAVGGAAVGGPGNAQALLSDPGFLKWAANFRSEVQDPVSNYLGHVLPEEISGVGGGWDGMWKAAQKDWTQTIPAHVSHFFSIDIPNFLSGTQGGWSGLWSQCYKYWAQTIPANFGHFFGTDIPNFFGGTQGGWTGLWNQCYQYWTQTIPDTFGHFFGTDIPDFFGGTQGGWTGLWNQCYKYWTQTIPDNLGHFFGTDIPEYFGQTHGGWTGLMDRMWTDFRTRIIDNIGNFFTHTLPQTIENAFKSSVNWVIRNVINKAIGLVNDVTGIVGVPKIHMVQQLAGGGHVMGSSVSGAGDFDSQHAILTPGEFVVRKPARMALDQAFGPEFLSSYVNQADNVLAGRYAGGGSVGSIDSFLESLPGRVPYSWGGVGPSGYDCSGLTGEVYARLLGFPDYRRYFVTQDFGSPQEAADLGFRQGLGAYTVGVNPATHMVGNLEGLKFEARDTQDGIIVGPNATDVRSMQVQYHLDRLGGAFVDSGGGGGFLSALENVAGALTGAGKDLLGLLGGTAKSLLGLAGKGAEAVFNAGWGDVVEPLAADLTGAGSVAGAVSQAFLDNIKKSVDKTLSSWDKSQTTSPLPGGGTPRANAELARKMMPAWAGGTAWAAWNALEMAEAGWNNLATNPSSGAFGIAQALGHGVPGGAGKYGNEYGGEGLSAAQAQGANSGNPGDQIAWMINYIKSTYATPENAEAHELAHHWYATGGMVTDGSGRPRHLPGGNPSIAWKQLFHPPDQAALRGKHPAAMAELWSGGDVVNAVREAASVSRIRQAMLFGAWLESRWDPSARGGAGVFSTGAWQLPTAGTPHVTPAHAEDPYWAARYVHPAYVAAVGKAGWSKLPQDAALAAQYAQHHRQSFYATQGAEAVTAGWADTLNALGIRVKLPAGAPVSRGAAPSQDWAEYSGELGRAAKAEQGAFWSLFSAFPAYPSLAGKLTPGERSRREKLAKHQAQWYAELLILRAQQEKMLGLGGAGDFGRLWKNVSDPQAMTVSEWSDLSSSLETMQKWESGPGEGGTTPPRSAWAAEKTGTRWPKGITLPWKPGDIPPDPSMLVGHEKGPWRALRTSLSTMLPLEKKALAAWSAIYGPSGSLAKGMHPGRPTPGPGKGPPSSALPVTGYYNLEPLVTAGGPAVPVFAAGGSVGDVASMFAMASGGGVPGFRAPLPSMPAQPGSTLPPRAVSDAGQAGQGGTRIGIQVNGVTVNNPVPERAGDSIAHRVQRLALLAGRQLI